MSSSKPTVFKITKQDDSTIRRFTMPTSNPSWEELSTKVREIFEIPKQVRIGLTYLDEEGDVITFSSETELQEIYNDERNSLMQGNHGGLIRQETVINLGQEGNIIIQNNNIKRFGLKIYVENQIIDNEIEEIEEVDERQNRTNCAQQ
ncbi:12443_t:CDS:1 [Dentiscutata heterogama]|uniref:12443_t:CDS:1 n=1 Tax=Dentiscutata heterogama TaxID=1316150 RepID=A0ACA9LRE6_9GLOM|nr:12443_t:CDS:1 [Dentiscutata heterogama]